MQSKSLLLAFLVLSNLLTYNSCRSKQESHNSFLDACNKNDTFSDINLQSYKAPMDLFQMSLPKTWYQESKFEDGFLSLSVIDTTQINSVKTLIINVNKVDVTLDEYFSTELVGIKKEFKILDIGENLITQNDKWVLNEEELNDLKLINLLIYTINNSAVYLIHLTIDEKENYSEELCKFKPILKSFSLKQTNEDHLFSTSLNR